MIIVLRDPVERAWSQYSYEVARGNEDLSFAEALDAEADRLAGAEERIRSGRSADDRHWRLHAYRPPGALRGADRRGARAVRALAAPRGRQRGAVRPAARR